MNDLTYNDSMINEIRELLISARQNVAVQVNTELLSTYWNVGRIIVEYEQENRERAGYGKQTLKQLSKDLTQEFGKGFSRSNLQNMRAFYLAYPICQTVSGKLSWSHYCELLTISDVDKRSFYEKKPMHIIMWIWFSTTKKKTPGLSRGFLCVCARRLQIRRRMRVLF